MPDWRLMSRLRHRLRSVLRRSRVERELDDELQFYIDERTAFEVARGRSPEEARRLAIRALDGIEQKKEECRDARGTHVIDDAWRDIRYGCRTLTRSPGFAVTAMLSLALGIGANAAIFSIVDKLLLESLPVERPQELVLLRPAGLRNGWTAGNLTWSYPTYCGLRDRQQVFDGLVAARTDGVNVTIDGTTRPATASIVSGNYFDVLGVRPFGGRLLSDADDRIRSGHPVAVLAHGFWATRLGGRADAVGSTIRIGGHPFTVIGIAQRGFSGLEVGGSVDVFVPAAMLPQVVNYRTALDTRTAYIFVIYGRLKADVSRQQAEAQLQPLYLSELEQDVAGLGEPRAGTDWRQGKLILEDGYRGTSYLRANLEGPLTAVMAMTVMVLLITCSNLAGLQMSRAAARRKEMSIRLAIGASRWRVVRQLFTESTLVAALGAAAGLLVARLTVGLLIAEMGDEAERLQLDTTFIDARVLMFALAVSAAAAILFGLLPALFATRTSVSSALREGAAGEASGHVRLRRGLVMVQVALGLVLIAASGLFLRTLYNLRHTDAGIQTDRLVQFDVNAGAAGYDRRRTEALFRQVLEELRSLPGVANATLCVAPVMSNAMIGFSLDVEGYVPAPRESRRNVANAVAPGYFAMVGTPLVRGRDFAETDAADAHRVAVVSESFVRKYFRDRDPLGKTFSLAYGGATRYTHEIVGVVKDARLNNPRDEPERTFYLPYSQFEVLNDASMLVRASADPDALRRPIEELVKRHDPEIPVSMYRTLEDQIDRVLQSERLVASLSLAFGVLATGLAAVGLYGVVAFSVVRRTREIGVRLALGATRTAVLRMVLRDVAAIAAVGIALGTLVAVGLGRYVEAQLYGVRAIDITTIGAAAGVLTMVALASGWLPARRASRVDPALTLRHE